MVSNMEKIRKQYPGTKTNFSVAWIVGTDSWGKWLAQAINVDIEKLLDHY
jgi:hypothetical protein